MKVNEIDRLKYEDIIWFIFIIIICFNIYSNLLEEEYLYNKNKKLKNIFQTINIITALIVTILYFYFVIVNYHRVKENNQKLSRLALIISLLFFIGGLLSLYIVFKTKTEQEIAVE